MSNSGQQAGQNTARKIRKKVGYPNVRSVGQPAQKPRCGFSVMHGRTKSDASVEKSRRHNACPKGLVCGKYSGSGSPIYVIH